LGHGIPICKGNLETFKQNKCEKKKQADVWCVLKHRKAKMIHNELK